MIFLEDRLHLGVLDADIFGPSQPRLLGLAGRLPTAGRIALAVECGIQNSALGITVAVSLLSISGLAVPSVIYAFLMNITALALIVFRQLQVSRSERSGANVTCSSEQNQTLAPSMVGLP